jgi:hypothetical protein
LLDIFEICQRALEREAREHSGFDSTTDQLNGCSREQLRGEKPRSGLL